jgi:hypothetical protein
MNRFIILQIKIRYILIPIYRDHLQLIIAAMWETPSDRTQNELFLTMSEA